MGCRDPPDWETRSVVLLGSPIFGEEIGAWVVVWMYLHVFTYVSGISLYAHDTGLCVGVSVAEVSDR